MTLMGSLYFFLWAAVLMIPAVILGVKEKPIRYYGFFVTIVFAVFATVYKPITMAYLGLYCLWEPTWLFNTHPSARISRSISFDVIGICVLLAQLLYQNIRAYSIRIDAKRINKKKEVNPSLKYRVYM